MKKHFLTWVALIGVAFASFGQSSELYFASFPTLSPDGKTLVFCYETDLWKADLSTKTAARLTAMQGNESRPKISPDGKWIAFTSNQYGSLDVYVMPLTGGEIKQLTFSEAGERVESWSWDSQKLYIQSNANNGGTVYTIPVGGGTPKRVFKHFFNRVHSVAEHPTSGELFFNDTWESDNQAQRKGYKGEFNPDVQSYNLKTKEYKRYTDYLGKDMWVTIDRGGKIYFVSDEDNGEYNLYTFENNKKKQLTSFKESIKYPQVSANGEKIAFEKDYQLWLYDVASKRSEKLAFTVIRNFTLPQSQDFNVRNSISSFDTAPDNKKLAFVSRGQLFVSDLEGKYIQQLKTRPDGRVGEVKWLADSRTLIFSQTVGGYQNWFSTAADGSSPEKQLTSDARNNRDLVLNKDRSMGVYNSGRDEVRTIDLKIFVSKTIVKDEIWAFQSVAPSFSPNDEYVLFTAHRDFEQDIFIHQLATAKTINLTNTGITETDPYWSPDGNYIYFTSQRLKASYPFGMPNSKVYRLALTKIDAPYRADKFAELFKKEEPKKEEPKKVEEKKTDEKKPEEKKEEPKKIKPIELDLTDLMDRIEQIGPNFGTQNSPIVIQKDAKTFVLYLSNHDEGTYNLYKTTYEPFVATKTEKIEGASGFFSDFVQADGKYYGLLGGNIHKLNLDANKVEKIDIGFTFRRNFADEFSQMVQETWANVEENFYNETFHGLDWKKTYDKYSKFVPYLNNRQDLRTLLNDMLGELNSSHMGFSSFGNEENTLYSTRTLATGILFDDENPYRVAGIIKKSAADRKGKDIQVGDVLTKVNGEAVNSTQNRDYYFSKPSLDAELELTFDRNGSPYTVRLHPASLGQQRDNLYDEWIAHNQNYVDTKSNNRVAYVHMKDMGLGEYEKFVVDMTQDWYKKDALIVDLRYNTGGNVHDLVLNFLSQRPYLQWKYREGKLTPQPNFSPAAKPIVLLINEQSLSDAEMTATGFKALNLGKIIGTETYRWIIFTSGKGLVDGSFYRLPSWGCYTLDGKNIEKEGVKPDVYVKQTFVDRLQDKDPQLDKALEELLKGLK
ncbi:MAG: S41 family peptidase [Spirosomataceae bacterium]